MQKPILFIITTVIISSPNLSLSMKNTNKYKTSSIDLMLSKKKAHISTVGYISTYDWCIKRAEEFLNEQRSAILQGLNMSQEEFKFTKEAFKETIEKNIIEPEQEQLNACTEQDETHDCQINQAIKDTLKSDTLRNLLNIKKVYILNDILHAERKNACTIKFFKTHKNSNSISHTDGHNVFISTKLYSKAKDWWLKECSLEAHIGHELAHILCKHFIEKKLFEALCELQITKKENKIQKFELDLLLTKFIIATEIQADILGLFNNKKWAQDQLNCYSVLIKETENSNYDNYADNKHPKFKERANYFKEILSYMQKESIELT